MTMSCLMTSAFLFLLAGSSSANVNVTVNTTNTVRILQNAVGINLDYLVDNEQAFPRTTGLTDALGETGVQTLRFPMGELADRYLFGYDSAQQKDISRCSIEGNLGPYAWPAYVHQSDGTFPGALTTADFIALAESQSAVPFFVVGVDALLADRSNGQTGRPEVEGYWASDYTAVSRSELLASVSNWVTYVQAQGVSGAYWEIGNETYLDEPSVGGWIPEKYAAVVNELSALIKSIDSTAKIGCGGGNWYQPDWWERILPIVEDQVDFLIVHEYALGSNFKDYSGYTNYTGSLTPKADLAEWHLNNTVSPSNRSRIRICATEISSHTAGGNNTQPNNLGRALMNFNLIGDLLLKPDVSHLHFWITRYLNANRFTSGEWSGLYKDVSALDDDNNLLPMGTALQLWGQFVNDRMVGTISDSSMLESYASLRASDSALNVFLLNKGGSGQNVAVTLNGYFGNSENMCWRFSGSDPDSVAPVLSSVASVSLINGKFSVWTPPYSVTVVEFAPEFDSGISYHIVNLNNGSLLELDNPSVDGANAQIWEDRGGWAKQKWIFERDTAGYYEIVNQALSASYKRLEVGDPQGSGLNVVGWTDRGGWDRQKWSVAFDATGAFQLINKATDEVLEAEGGGVTNGTNVQVGDPLNWNKQRWLIFPAD